jgi:uncharacterized protein YqgV (UPF0045/DUF77 family)
MLIDIQTTELGRVRAIFRVDQPREVLIELSINPVGSETFSGEQLLQILKTIQHGRLDGEPERSHIRPDNNWEEVLALLRSCHDAVRGFSSQVITTVRIQETISKALYKSPELKFSEERRSQSLSGDIRIGAHSPTIL